MESVCILVLNWNRKQDTLECLESIFKMDYPDFEVVVIDNASSDGSAAAVAERFPTVTIIRNSENFGYAAGNNAGIRYALEKNLSYIFILNNDVIVSPDILTVLVKAAKQEPRTIFSPKIYVYANPNQIFFAGMKWDNKSALFSLTGMKKNDAQGTYDKREKVDFPIGCAIFSKLDIFRKVGFFDDRFFLMWEDVDWGYRARKLGYEIVMEPLAKIWHKISVSFDGRWAGEKYQYFFSRNRLLWIEKHLHGTEKIRTYIKCFIQPFLALLRLDQTALKKTSRRGRVKGTLDYCLRRFGRGPY